MFRNMFGNIFKGRYGVDTLSIVLFLGAAVLTNNKYTRIIGAGLFAYALFRMFSRNTGKRYQELQKFNGFYNKIRPFFMRWNMAFSRGIGSMQRKYMSYRLRQQQKKQYFFFKCSRCKNTLRVPRNKGKILVTCPVCKLEFLKKT